MRSLAEVLVRRGAEVDVIGHGIPVGGDAGAPWSVKDLGGPARDERGDVARTSVLVGSPAPDVVIVDHYALGEVWELGIAERFPGTRIVAIDDLPGRTHAVDLVIDPNLGPGGPESADGSPARVLTGTAYVPLGSVYLPPAEVPSRPKTGPTVLVALGGGRSGVVRELAAALAEDARLQHVGFELVVPDAAEHADVSRRLRERPRCTVHGRVPTLRPLLERADLAIGAGGTSAWQRLRLGRPAVMVTLAQNQVRAEQALQDLGLARVVDPRAGAPAVVDMVLDALDDMDLRHRASELGPLLVDGRGAERIALALFPPSGPPTLRLVEEGDAPALLAMANDPETRAGSREARSIRPDEHLDWFRHVRDRAGATFWVAEIEGLVVGQVRFMPNSGGWELNYGLDPIARGLGWSAPMVREGLRRLAASPAPGDVFAVVGVANEPSRRCLTGLGFLPADAARVAASGVRLPDGFAAYVLADSRVAG